MVAKRRLAKSPSANRPPPSGDRPLRSQNQNRLLAALPDDVYARVTANVEIIPLPLKTFLYKPGESIDHVYFPGGGFCSIVTVLADGSMVEVATIGREGMVGLLSVSGDRRGASAAMVQAEASLCYRLPLAGFQREMERRGPFYELLSAYAHALTGAIMQSTACNAVHSVEQRLARWLLMAHDRVGTDEFPLTQEFVAMMLGATRPTVTIVAGTLQRAGLITYHRGHVTVVDRRALESASCECYRAATDLMTGVVMTRTR
ncbi:MAG: Crp/Fnr family transcriptional regulator [Acidobacteriota bacterium]